MLLHMYFTTSTPVISHRKLHMYSEEMELLVLLGKENSYGDSVGQRPGKGCYFVHNKAFI